MLIRYRRGMWRSPLSAAQRVRWRDCPSTPPPPGPPRPSDGAAPGPASRQITSTPAPRERFGQVDCIPRFPSRARPTEKSTTGPGVDMVRNVAAADGGPLRSRFDFRHLADRGRGRMLSGASQHPLRFRLFAKRWGGPGRRQRRKRAWGRGGAGVVGGGELPLAQEGHQRRCEEPCGQRRGPGR